MVVGELKGSPKAWTGNEWQNYRRSRYGHSDVPILLEAEQIWAPPWLARAFSKSAVRFVEDKSEACVSFAAVVAARITAAAAVGSRLAALTMFV